MINCSGCNGSYDKEDMVIESAEVVYCLSCAYENSAKLDNLTDEE